MKWINTLGVLMLCLGIIMACDKKNPAGSDSITFASTDFVGNWTGNVSNSSVDIDLDLNVDESGKVIGDGVSSTWSITTDGKVTGGGTFNFIAGSSYTVAAAGWNLQMNDAKTTLTGTFDVAYSGLHNMNVTLTKQ